MAMLQMLPRDVLRPRNSGRSLAVAAMLVSVACSAPTNTAANKIRTEPATLDFGFVPPNALVTKPVLIVNEGDVAVGISGIVVVDDKRSAYATADAPQRLLPGERGTLNVTYHAPAEAGEDPASIKIASTAEQTPTLVVTLLARTAAATCADTVRNGAESDVDCGGECEACGSGKACLQPRDCGGGAGCVSGHCAACATDSDCSAGALCRAGACSGCREDADCPSGNTCAAGTCTRCATASGRIDTKTDANNCGACGNICATPLNAVPSCRAGACGRGSCRPGYFDIDGAATFGCEATCVGAVCTAKDGTKIQLTAPPLSDRTRPLGTNNGASTGAELQTSRGFTNAGILGESPAPVPGAVQQSDHYRNQGGFSPALR
jgi:Cys-rich repeat protein